MPLKINILPNKSIHPGSTGFAGSRESAGGGCGRGGGVRQPPIPGTLRDGAGVGAHHSARCCRERQKWDTSLLGLSDSSRSRRQSTSFGSLALGWQRRTDGAHASPSKCGERGVKVTRSQQSLPLRWLVGWDVLTAGSSRRMELSPRELGLLRPRDQPPASCPAHLAEPIPRVRQPRPVQLPLR